MRVAETQVFLRFYNDFRLREIASQIVYKPNGVLMLLGASLQKNHSKVSINDSVYKVSGTRFSDRANRCFTSGFPRFSETAKPHLGLLINLIVF